MSVSISSGKSVAINLTERQSARMSKITNDGLTRPGTGSSNRQQWLVVAITYVVGIVCRPSRRCTDRRTGGSRDDMCLRSHTAESRSSTDQSLGFIVNITIITVLYHYQRIGLSLGLIGPLVHTDVHAQEPCTRSLAQVSGINLLSVCRRHKTLITRTIHFAWTLQY